MREEGSGTILSDVACPFDLRCRVPLRDNLTDRGAYDYYTARRMQYLTVASRVAERSSLGAYQIHQLRDDSGISSSRLEQ
jgi:hypothetical protein